MLHPHRRTLAALAVAVAVVVAVAGHTLATADQGPAAGAPVELVDVPTEWGDDHNHFVVTGDDTFFADTAAGAEAALDVPVALPAATTAVPVGFVDGDPLPAGAAAPVTAIIAADDHEAAVAASLPDGFVLARDAAGTLWGWSADGRWWNPGLAATAPTVEPDPTAPVVEPDDADTVVVGPVPSGDEAFIDALVDTGLFLDIRPLGSHQAAVTTDASADDVAGVDGVVAVEDDLLLHLAATPNDPDYGRQWMIDNTGATSQAGGWAGVADADMDVPGAWTVADGSGVVVAVVDSGVATSHPDLAANLWHPAGEVCGNGVDDDANGYIDDCNGWDFGSGDNDPTPGSDSGRNHGTHVAGIVAATANNGVGVAGVAPGAQVMALRASRTDGTIPASAVLAATRYAIANGADIINLSLATPPGTARSAASSLETAVGEARAAGVLVVAGTGNNGVDTTGTATVWPAGFSAFYDNVIAAGATTNSDTRASFSNWGSALSVYAPGYFIWSTIADGNSYGWMSGTSMATPAVAAAAAVLIDADPSATPAQLRSTLVATADATVAGPRVNLASALGVGEDGIGVSMTLTGVSSLATDTASTLVATVATAGVGDPAAVRLSFATLDAGSVLAIDGLDVTRPGGSVSSTGADGAIPPIGLDAAAARAGGDALAFSIAVPDGIYAVVAEVLDSGGAPVADPVVVSFAVDDEATTDPVPLPPTDPTDPPSGGGGATTPTTQPPSGGGGGTATTIPGDGGSVTHPTLPPGSGSGGATTPTTTPPPTGDGGTTPTTQPPAGGGGATTPTTQPPAGGGATTPTTQPPSGGGGGTTPTTQPPGGGGDTTPPPGDGGNGSTPPPEETPEPAPDSDGPWRLDGADPRLAPLSGQTAVTLTGVFPTGRDLYVWFGSTPVIARSSNATTMTVAAPARAFAGVVDLSVRFRDGTVDRVLTLDGAFTYYDADGTAPPPGGDTPPPSGGGTTPTTQPPSGGGGGGSTPTTQPPSGGGGSTPTTQPPSGGVGSPAPGPVVRTRGGLALRTPTSGSAVAQLSVASFASLCATDTCVAATV